ncbi:YihY/virulence factor BrkB family protein [Sphingomonas naphthae]|uniref:YihY/virulence factor BrkB family protein n=1 Tax=Sphingomonas naphthae TaxID=1813468 RepID=A0ABY7TKW1_9SPHN|nr:YihY/virulence factor BrkB family protein [Sphingomonas naphthae]WCT73877.1 YihY/virulence factor BrkB family protein [Sphingomonas naphthae]
MATTQADPHGRRATSPIRLPWPAWKEIGARVWAKTGTDNISLLAAGVAFYAFLAMVPLFGAVVMTYGLVADPANVAKHMQTIIELVPADAAKLIYQQLIDVTTAAAGKKGLGLLIALVLSLYGATRAAGGIIMALNVIYEQPERRSFIWTTLLTFAITIGAVLVGIVGLVGASVLALIEPLTHFLGDGGAIVMTLLTWIVAGALASTAIGATYRFAPDRQDARWRWLSFGSLLATALWLVATVGFGFYASRFGDYNATYGSLGAVVVLLLWLYVSAYAILLGAEVNAETERQTAVDSTTGRPRPMGQRGATMADTVPPADGEPAPPRPDAPSFGTA